VHHYFSEGFVDNIGLFACGVIARVHSPSLADFGSEWFVENTRWSIQDQLSFPFLLWKRGVLAGTFNEHLWDGPLRWKDHKRPTE
jgi:hypothetical protein